MGAGPLTPAPRPRIAHHAGAPPPLFAPHYPCVYDAHMARVNIYLSKELHQLVRAANIPISEVCQRALRAELQRCRQESAARRAILWDRTTNNRRP